jgi:uncharacterized protein
VKKLYGAGGYLREQVTGAPRVYGVVNRPELKKALAKVGIDPVGSEITTITWFNGLILGLSTERKIDAIGLFGEIAETTVPQPLAAKSILSAFTRLEGIQIDTKPLDQQYESILEEIQKKKSHQNSGLASANRLYMALIAFLRRPASIIAAPAATKMPAVLLLAAAIMHTIQG